MNDNLRRRKAAFELRKRAADALDEAPTLDGLTAMGVLITDLRKIAAAAGVDPSRWPTTSEAQARAWFVDCRPAGIEGAGRQGGRWRPRAGTPGLGEG